MHPLLRKGQINFAYIKGLKEEIATCKPEFYHLQRLIKSNGLTKHILLLYAKPEAILDLFIAAQH